jgi:hypothetical protein
MSLWADLRNAIQQVILMQERVERLIADVEKSEDRLFDHDRRITRIETLIAVTQRDRPLPPARETSGPRSLSGV